MRFFRIGEQPLEPSYNGFYEPLQPNDDAPQAPFYSSYFHVPPGQTTKRHRHFEAEFFIAVRGEGYLGTGTERIRMEPGDMVQLSPFEPHSFYNPSQHEPWVLMSAFWPEQQRGSTSELSNQNTVHIFSAPPTPNGDLHLGHFSGPILASDFVARHLKRAGKHVMRISGVDAHLSFVTRQALLDSKTPLEVAEENTNQIQSSLSAMNIEFERFLVPQRTPEFSACLNEALADLLDRGFAQEREIEDLFCSTTGEYLVNALVEGQCPHCQAPTVARECENCGKPHEGVDMLNPISLTDRKPPEIKRFKSLMFDLEPHREQITAYVESLDLPLLASRALQQQLSQPLPSFSLTLPHFLGYPVTLPGFEGQVMNPYFDWVIFTLTQGAPFHGIGSMAWREGWTTGNIEKVFCIGFDNLFDHVILQSALHTALLPDIRLPRHWLVNEFLLLNGTKFSTSRNHVIRVADISEGAHHGAFRGEALKWYLALVRSENQQCNFTLEEFEAFEERIIEDRFLFWLTDLENVVRQEFAAVSPTPGAWRQEDRVFYEQLQQHLENLQTHANLESFSLNAYSLTLCRLLEDAVEYHRQVALTTDLPGLHDECRTKVALSITAARLMLVTLSPLMPETVIRWAEHLGLLRDIEYKTMQVCSNTLVEYATLPQPAAPSPIGTAERAEMKNL